MYSKGKSIIYLLVLCLVTAGLILLSLFGAGENRLFGYQGIKLGLDLSGGVYITYEAEKDAPSSDEMRSAVSMIQDRLDRKGWTEAEVSQQGSKRIRVEIPGVADADTAVQDIGQTAQLQFKDEDGNILLTGSDIASAHRESGTDPQTGVASTYVALTFTTEGTKKFADATAANVGKVIHIALDDGVISSPTVQQAISDGAATITGNFTAESAEELAALIRAGSLPFNLSVIEMNNVGARLGSDAMETSLFAGVIGMILVVLFMIFVYRISGLCANWALIFYLALELIILSAFKITLTLPGVAGIILTIGMAVDANIIIFERLNEELALGKTLRASIEAAFSRAFPAILDSNITTLIASIILFYLGTGPIKGFAQTFMIGIILSMFSSLVITHFILKCLVALNIKKVSLFGRVKIAKGEK